jgi:PKD repeat protein
VTIVEPTGNQPPAPTFTVSCQGLTCAVNSTGTADPNNGDSVNYAWEWGDELTSSGSSPSAHTFAEPGAYTITLTTTDGWGEAASTTRSVSLVEPAGNTAPAPQFTSSCLSFTACTFNSAGTVDAQGDVIKYAWTFGDGSTSTSANPSRTYSTTGTYTVTLTTTDVWGQAAMVSHDVTITEPADNNAPTAVFASATCTTTNTTCTMSAAGSSDPDTATGDGIRNYVWTWEDGTADTTGTSASQSHVFSVAGTYTVTLTVLDRWGRASEPVTMEVTTASEPAGNNPPTVVFNQPACSGLTCTVSSSGSTDIDGGIRNYTWRWGDGTPDTVTSSTNNRNHTYAAAGTYTITLIATDNWGRTTEITREVTVA